MNTTVPLPYTMLVALACAAIPGLLHPSEAIGAQEAIALQERDEIRELLATEVYRVGGMKGPDWSLFGRIATLAFDGSGNLYAHDIQNNRIVVVDPEGELLREVAERGGGPGEFGAPMAMAVSADGSLVVFDAGHMAFMQFGPDGTYLDQEPHSFENGLPSPGGLFIDPSGGVLFSTAGTVAIRRGPGGDSASEGLDGRPIRRVLSGDDDGVVVEAWKLPAEARMETVSGGGGFQLTAAMPTLRAFEPELFFGPLANSDIVLADTVDYALKILSRDGRVLRVLRRPIQPRTVGRRERAAERERRLAEAERQAANGGVRMLVRGGGGAQSQSVGSDAIREMLVGRIEAMEFAEQMPVVAGMRVDPWRDQIWVSRSGGQVGEEGPTDVLGGQGAYLGTLEGDDARIPMAFGPGGLAAYLETDDLDVPTIVVRRLEALK